MRKRSIPVMLGDVLVGVAVAEQYPDLDSGAAVFEAELEVARVPPSWAGKRVPLLRVEQSKSWPGPFPLRIFVSPDAQRS